MTTLAGQQRRLFPGIDPDRSYAIMGVVNVTPDSFSDGGHFLNVEAAIEHARMMVEDGADILDIGGESSRPGAMPVSEDEERDRVVPVVEGIRKYSDIPLSIDTTKAAVADATLHAGANVINDISALRADPRMPAVIQRHEAAVILMHMQGNPATMQINPGYHDVTAEVRAFFDERLAFCEDAGIDRIAIDPGIGFGKKLQHNLDLLRRLDLLSQFDVPIVIGTSRKSFLGQLTGREVREREAGTLASSLLAWMRGARIIRVHDARAMRDALIVAEAINGEYVHDH